MWQSQKIKDQKKKPLTITYTKFLDVADEEMRKRLMTVISGGSWKTWVC